MDGSNEPKAGTQRRMAVLWSHLSGYLNACLRECQRRDVALLTSWFRAESQAPFAEEQFSWLRDHGRGYEWAGSAHIDSNHLGAALGDFKPDMTLISGWHHPGYRRVARQLSGKSLRVLCMDNAWEERPKQWLGRAVASWYVRPLFDAALVAGERQYQFARRLGFSDGEIITGLYAPDSERFAAVESAATNRKGFVFVGRLAPEKGVQTLADAYRIYRRMSTAPWPLTVAGTGPLQSAITGIDGVKLAGFVQPDALAPLLLRHACMVVPSHREPWGVQISEGASAGLALIATAACGATVHLVREGFNGHVIPAKDPRALAHAMLRIEVNVNVEQFGRNGRVLAGQFTPRIWADNLLSLPTQGTIPVESRPSKSALVSP